MFRLFTMKLEFVNREAELRELDSAAKRGGLVVVYGRAVSFSACFAHDFFPLIFQRQPVKGAQEFGTIAHSRIIAPKKKAKEKALPWTVPIRKRIQEAVWTAVFKGASRTLKESCKAAAGMILIGCE